jgi:tetratricopeptide (TPR) repeat protein
MGGLRPIWISLALIAITLFVYASVRRFEFVNWDDPQYITENANVLGGLTWQSATWALTTAASPYWHPVTWLSHLLDIRLYGLDAGAHHVTNLVLHIANSLLLFGVFRSMTNAAGASAFVAAVFAVHPLHVESVAWVTERKDVLSTGFLLLTIAAYVAYVRRPRWQNYVLVLALYTLALMSKPMVVTLPFVLLLLDVWPLERGRWTRLIVEKIPLLTLAVATGVATLVVQSRVGAVAGLDALPLQARISNAAVADVIYIWKTIWPTNLAAFYPYRPVATVSVLVALLALLGASVAAIRFRRRAPYLLTGWFWYVITVAPVIGLMQAGEQSWADRFTYVPMIGLLIIVSWGIPRLLTGTNVTRDLPVAALVIICALAVTARAQVAHWSDSLSLWQHAARVTDGNYVAYEKLGEAFRDRGQLEDARDNYARAMALAPPGSPKYAAIICNNLGLILTRQGRTDEAAAQFAAAVRFNPGFAEAQGNLGNALASAGRLAEATEHYRAAVRLKPDFTEARVGLGSALLSQGQTSEAITHYWEALRIKPNIAEAYNGLGAALALQGEVDRAMNEYEKALQLRPDLATAHYNVAMLLIKRNRLDEARRHLQDALKSDPGYAPAQQALAQLSAIAGRTPARTP